MTLEGHLSAAGVKYPTAAAAALDDAEFEWDDIKHTFGTRGEASVRSDLQSVDNLSAGAISKILTYLCQSNSSSASSSSSSSASTSTSQAPPTTIYPRVTFGARAALERRMYNCDAASTVSDVVVSLSSEVESLIGHDLAGNSVVDLPVKVVAYSTAEEKPLTAITASLSALASTVPHKFWVVKLNKPVPIEKVCRFRAVRAVWSARSTRSNILIPTHCHHHLWQAPTQTLSIATLSGHRVVPEKFTGDNLRYDHQLFNALVALYGNLGLNVKPANVELLRALTLAVRALISYVHKCRNT